MPLSDYELPSDVMSLGKSRSGEEITVTLNPISFFDLSKLVNKHGPVFALAYAKFTVEKKKNDLRPETVGLMLADAAKEFPEAVGEIIALSAGEPDMASKAAKMKVTLQAEALMRIVQLTFESEAEVKKFVEIVTKMFVATTGTINSLTDRNGPTLSANGGGSFASK